MPMTITFTFAPGQIIYASRFNTNFSNVKSWADAHEIATTGIHGVGAGAIMGTTLTQDVSGKNFTDNLRSDQNVVWKSGTAFTGTLDHTNTGNRVYTFPNASGTVAFTSSSQFVPIGTIIPFYDFNAALTFDSTNWAYCNGQSIAVGGIGMQTLPDLSGRYLVGFGTDGGGDNGSASWATPPVGNAGNTINIQHLHTVDSHTHSVPGLSYSGTTSAGTTSSDTTGNESSHTHGPGSYQFQISDTTQASQVMTSWNFYISDGTAKSMFTGGGVRTSDVSIVAGGGPFTNNNDETLTFYTKNGSGNSGAGSSHNHSIPSLTVGGLSYSGTTGTGTSGGSTPGTNNALSTTQSIQPISIRVRFLMRIL